MTDFDPAQTRTGRIVGYDVARALAVYGMIIVNFKVVMGADNADPHWTLSLSNLFDGRAAATFVVLAGVSLSLMTRSSRESDDARGLAANRRDLLKRSLFLFLVGFAYTPIWPADILHFYGVYISVGALLLAAPNRLLWTLSILFVFIFSAMFLTLDYELGWDWSTLDYDGFWTPGGMIRNLFFNGFHPVFPWTAFLLVGMVIGRGNLRSVRTRRITILLGILVALFVEALSYFLVETLSFGANVKDAEDIAAVFGTEPLPPVPFFMIAGTGWAAAVIAFCVEITERWPGAAWYRPLVSTGQLALTLYVAHVTVGMGGLEAIGRLESQSPTFALQAATLFFAASVLFSWWWSKRFDRGPLEIVMRKVTSA